MTNEYVLGIDLGGTKTNIAKVFRDGSLDTLQRFEIGFSNHQETLKDLFAAADAYISAHCEAEKPLRIGLGLKGHALRDEGVWNRCITIPEFKPLNIVGMFEDRYNVRTLLDNDVHAATLAELYFGAGLKYHDFVYYNIGTGISAGIVADAQLVRGATNYSGEIGYMVAIPDDNPANFGVCLEDVASGGAMIEAARAALPRYPDSILNELNARNELFSRSIFAAADNGDDLAVHIAKRALRAINMSAIAVVQMMNPQALIFGGGVMTDGWLLHKISEYLYKHTLRPTAAALEEVAVSNLGTGDVGVLGAACLGWEDIQIN